MFNNLIVSSPIKKQGGRLPLQGEPLSFLCDDFAIKLPIQTRNNQLNRMYSFSYIPRNLIMIRVVI